MTDPSFVDAAVEAFDGVARAFGLELVDRAEGEWFASVVWSRAERGSSHRLRVTDDRRDLVVEVFVDVPLPDPVPPDLSVLVRGDALSLPLWAIVEAAGDDTDLAGRGAARRERLPDLARAVERWAGPFLGQDEPGVDAVAAVVGQRQWEWSEEGRRARRWLP